MKTAIWATLILVGGIRMNTAAQDIEMLDNVVESNGVYTLAPGPNVDGLVLVQQVNRGEDDWPEKPVKVLETVPWIDAASIRMVWCVLEPEDEKFDWTAIDKVLDRVRRYNEEHPDANRTAHIRVMGGRFCPDWFEDKGVRYYETTVNRPTPGEDLNLRTPMPYDNPEFLKQLREVYRAMRERYKDDPLVTVYHGTWSAGPWDEIFHPVGQAPLPPDYTQEKFVKGMTEQLDVLIDEFCLKGKVAELPYSGQSPHKTELDLTGPLTERIVERLGRHSPFLYIQTNGWGQAWWTEEPRAITGRAMDVNEAFGQVNLAFQALGTNSEGWRPQGDWVPLIRLAQRYQTAYVELYWPDFFPMDEEHHIVEAFTQTHAEGESGDPGTIPNFVGYRPWLARRARVLYVRQGTARLTFHCKNGPQPVDRLAIADEIPAGTSVVYRARTRLNGKAWSNWKDQASVSKLPAGDEAQVEATLHTDDGYHTPTIILVAPQKDPYWEEVWQPVPTVGM